MSAHFALELDTTPPTVRFGRASGSTMGDLFTLNYNLNEPSILWADLVDGSGGRWPLTVREGRLERRLGTEIALGIAQVEVHARDDVMNEKLWTQPIEVFGALSVLMSDRSPINMFVRAMPKFVMRLLSRLSPRSIPMDEPEVKVTMSDRPALSLNASEHAAIKTTVTTKRLP